MTIEDLKKKHSSRPHNPILAGTFFKGGLIEAWGCGTIKIINECKKAGLPEPLIEYVSGGISVTIFKNDYSSISLLEMGLITRQIKAIEYLRENNQITNKIYQELCEVSKATATRNLTELIAKYKLLERFGDIGAGTIYKLIGS
ncbi:MAG TPA: hypothetical protein DCG75_12980 [Bacteroidales bacterium]|nr:hypothetical protein [Bacteroidales bacterium]